MVRTKANQKGKAKRKGTPVRHSPSPSPAKKTRENEDTDDDPDVIPSTQPTQEARSPTPPTNVDEDAGEDAGEVTAAAHDRPLRQCSQGSQSCNVFLPTDGGGLSSDSSVSRYTIGRDRSRDVKWASVTHESNAVEWVRANPCLWKKTDTGYMNRDKKHRLLIENAPNFNKTRE